MVHSWDLSKSISSTVIPKCLLQFEGKDFQIKAEGFLFQSVLMTSLRLKYTLKKCVTYFFQCEVQTHNSLNSCKTQIHHSVVLYGNKDKSNMKVKSNSDAS